MKKGFFITLYGINNMGKSTHAKRLVERINKMGKKAKYLKYPIYEIAPSGEFINDVLRGSADNKQKITEEELQMWFVLNRYQYQSELQKLLEEGYIVVAEDYVGTGIAWGIAKGLEKSWLEELNKYLVREDLAIMFEGERSVSAKESQHVHEQNDKLVEKCREVHDELAKEYGWKKLQLQPEKDATAELLWEMVERYL